MKTANPRRGRVLKFLCIHDASVRSVVDLGYTKGGDETGQRQAIKRMLSKRAMIDGRRVQVFLLAEIPEEEFSSSDPLDESLRTQGGEWQLPTEAWMAVRETRLVEQKRLAEEAGNRALEMATNNLAVQLGGLMKQTAASTTSKGAR